MKRPQAPGALGAALLVGLMLTVTACNSSGVSADSAPDLTGQGRHTSPAPSPVPSTTAGVNATFAVPNGRLLASNCFQCHGTDGKGPGFDEIAGESAAELIEEMREFRMETDLDEYIMRVHAESYSDAQIAQIADYFSKVR